MYCEMQHVYTCHNRLTSRKLKYPHYHFHHLDETSCMKIWMSRLINDRLSVSQT